MRPSSTKPNGKTHPEIVAVPEPEEAPPEKEPSLWALIPAKYRPLVLTLIVIGGSGSGAALANLRAIWSVPSDVAALRQAVAEQGKQLGDLAAAVRELAAKP